jgi:hypothetical protein
VSRHRWAPLYSLSIVTFGSASVKRRRDNITLRCRHDTIYSVDEQIVIMAIYGLSPTIAPGEGKIVLQRYGRVLAHLLMTSLDSFPLASIRSHKVFFATTELTKKCRDHGEVGIFKKRDLKATRR